MRSNLQKSTAPCSTGLRLSGPTCGSWISARGRPAGLSDLSRARLQGAHFDGRTCTETVLDDADMQNASLGERPETSRWQRRICARADLRNAQLAGAMLGGATLPV